jgi:uncharacterized protein
MSDQEVPLFPLKTVLFPGGPLPLRIFEPRYLDMIGRSLRLKQQFGVILIKHGSEVGEAETYDVGTMAEIVDWYQGSDGLLGVTAHGRQRFRLKRKSRQDDGLYVGEVKRLAAEPSIRLPEEYQPMAKLLEQVLEGLGKHYHDIDKAYDDATWVSYRFAEILPLPAETKQSLLEMEDALGRLALIRPNLK